MTAYFSSPAMAVFGELVQELVVHSLDFHTFSDVGADQARAGIRPAMRWPCSSWPAEGLEWPTFHWPDPQHGT